MTNIDLCGIAQLLRTLIEQKKTKRVRRREILARVTAQPVRTLSCVAEIAFFSKAISKGLR